MNFNKGDADAAVVRGRPHAVPRDGPRAARPAVRRHLSDRLLHQRADRLGRAAVAALRALARAAGGAAQVRAALQDRRADPRGAGAEADGGEELRPRLPDAGIHLLGAGRSRPASAARPPKGSTSTRSSARRSSASACRRRSRCGTGRRISPTCSPAAATPRPITATCGRRCSTPTPSRRSRRPATSSIRRSRASSIRHVLSTGGSRDPAELYVAFRGRLPTADALLKKRGFARRQRGRMTDLHTAGHRRGVVCAPHRGGRRGRPRHPGRGRQRARSHGGDGGDASPPSIRT